MEDKYLISEFYNLETPDRKIILEAERNDLPITMVGILQKADTLNRNGRIYPFEILKREVEKYMQLVEQKCAYAELDHPNEQIISFWKTSHMVTDMWWEGKVLYGKVVLFEDTPAGQIIKAILKRGGTIGISSRGVGSVKHQGGHDIVQDDFELIGFDFVTTPSTPGAYMFREGDERRRGMVKLDSNSVSSSLERTRNEDYQQIKKLINDDFWKKF